MIDSGDMLRCAINNAMSMCCFECLFLVPVFIQSRAALE
ncbi:Hypothetical protein RY69_208 [Bifidobacterium breve]|nr:Hypothetical protein RY69_208 [Bifidobacterium breve]